VCKVNSPHLSLSRANGPEKAKAKAIALLAPEAPTNPAAFSEFGTRRRRSFQVQDLVLRGLIEGHEELKAKGGKHGVLTGTSNVCSNCPHTSLLIEGVPRNEIWVEAYWDHCS
jgi:hypothetical protein